jgi:hypothetical protein
MEATHLSWTVICVPKQAHRICSKIASQIMYIRVTPAMIDSTTCVVSIMDPTSSGGERGRRRSEIIGGDGLGKQQRRRCCARHSQRYIIRDEYADHRSAYSCDRELLCQQLQRQWWCRTCTATLGVPKALASHRNCLFGRRHSQRNHLAGADRRARLSRPILRL